MEKLIITIAPTGNVPTKAMTPHVPITPLEICNDIVACYEQGAAVAHIHARDQEGKPTTDVTVFKQIMALLDQQQCPIVRQISTGARGGQAEARAAALVLKPASASLATGSSNFPTSANLNDPQLVEHLAQVMLANNIKPEIEVFDTAMINNAILLQQAGLIKSPLQFNLVLGVKGSLPATARNLMFLVESLPPQSIWSVSVIGPQHVPLSVMAIALGGHVRVGIEDNIYLTKGILATNKALVKRMVGIANAIGRELATPADVARIWQID